MLEVLSASKVPLIYIFFDKVVESNVTRICDHCSVFNELFEYKNGPISSHLTLPCGVIIRSYEAPWFVSIFEIIP